MVMVKVIESLFENVARLGDDELKCEILHKLQQVRGDVVALHGHLAAKETEIRSLNSRLAAAGNGNGPSNSFVYDPPV